VQCASNLRQVGIAMLQYLNANHGVYPTCAAGTTDNPWLPPALRSPPDTQPLSDEADYLYWQPGRNIDDSVLAKYIGLRGEGLKSIFRCPSDPWEARTAGYSAPFQYSYTMNWNINCKQVGIGYTKGQVKVRRPSEKFLMLDEDKPNDGCLSPGSYYPPPAYPRTDGLAVRHNGKGNALFMDYHVELVPPYVYDVSNWGTPPSGALNYRYDPRNIDYWIPWQ
jgi:prepilin-type processing-associated H-X9-DG protein